MKAKNLTTKVGSSSRERSGRRPDGENSAATHAPSASARKVSKIARLAVRDLDPSLRTSEEEFNLGWAGPLSLTSRRGAVGWSGGTKRRGPQLGPKTEHTHRQHRDRKWRGMQGDHSPNSPKEEVRTKKFESFRPHRGPISFSPRSQLNFAFDNEATIAARMKEIRGIAEVHREKEERRRRHQRPIVYDGGQRVVLT